MRKGEVAMKNIKDIRYVALLFLAFILTQTVCASQIYPNLYPVLDEESFVREEVLVATSIAEIKIKEAQNAINQARHNALQGRMTSAQAIKIIKEQNAEIHTIENTLKEKINQAVEKIDAVDAQTQENYLSSIVSGVKDLGSRAIAPFKSGYGYSKEQKEIAQNAIKGLIEQQAQLTNDYEKALKALQPSKVIRPGSEYDVLNKRYEEIIAALNDEIYQQQVITGDLMSMERKFFWAAVATGAAVAGAYFLAPGAAVTPEVVKEIKEKISDESNEKIISQDTARILVGEQATRISEKAAIEALSNLSSPQPTSMGTQTANQELDQSQTEDRTQPEADKTPASPPVGPEGNESDIQELTREEIDQLLKESDMELIRDEKESFFNLLDELAADRIVREGEEKRDEAERTLSDFKKNLMKKLSANFLIKELQL